MKHNDRSFDGLPPVGIECECRDGVSGEWMVAHIVAHHFNGSEAIWSEHPDGGNLFYGTAADFRRKSSVATITISGPVGCGKSIVAAKIAQVINDLFEATVESDDIDVESNMADCSSLEDWQADMVANTVWRIEEGVE